MSNREQRRLTAEQRAVIKQMLKQNLEPRQITEALSRTGSEASLYTLKLTAFNYRVQLRSYALQVEQPRIVAARRGSATQLCAMLEMHKISLTLTVSAIADVSNTMSAVCNGMLSAMYVLSTARHPNVVEGA